MVKMKGEGKIKAIYGNNLCNCVTRIAYKDKTECNVRIHNGVN